MFRSESIDSLVEQCPFPAGVVDLETLTYVSANDEAADLLGLDARPVGEHVLQFMADPDATAARLRFLRGSTIHSVESRWEFRRPDGTVIARAGWAASLVGHGNLLFVVAGPDGTGPKPVDVTRLPSSVLTVAAVDETWVIESVSSSITDLLGWRADQWRGRPILGELHPAEVASFCEAVTRGLYIDGGVSIEARLRTANASWQAISLGVIPHASERDLPPLTVTLAPSFSARSFQLNAGPPRWAGLAKNLPVAASEVNELLSHQLAGLQLSTRQAEILSRLLRGERVPSVAAAMSLSQSTIRTHLGAVFQKFGVGSQEELLRRARSALDDPSK